MKKKILLVEPDFYTRFPPLGLLKLATYFRKRGHQIKLVRGCAKESFTPNEIYITSLFTYTWKPVHQAVRFYKREYPASRILLGGLYASLLPEHAAKSGADEIFRGIFEEAETCIPAWDLVPEWDGSIMFTSRGCIRNCPFCAVPKLEGKLRILIHSIKPYVYPSHSRIIIWDNNLLATNNWNIFDELEELNKWVDFNQGLDARLIDEKVAKRLAKLKIKYIRLAYDDKKQSEKLENAIKSLVIAGIRRKSIVVYTLYNFEDDPEDFKERVTQLLNWGVVSYPMRFEPITSLEKNSFVSKGWRVEELEMVAKARRVLGFAGAFPPYEGLVKKFTRARDFHEAFSLRKAKITPAKKKLKRAKWAGGLNWRETVSLVK